MMPTLIAFDKLLFHGAWNERLQHIQITKREAELLSELEPLLVQKCGGEHRRFYFRRLIVDIK